VNSKGKEVPHGVRLYSIAASRYGDNFDGQTTSLCVRRATYWDPEMKANDPAKKGLCSNFLCDAKPGDEITMTGARPARSWRARRRTQAARCPLLSTQALPCRGAATPAARAGRRAGKRVGRVRVLLRGLGNLVNLVPAQARSGAQPEAGCVGVRRPPCTRRRGLARRGG
jgi:hypothetical protein